MKRMALLVVLVSVLVMLFLSVAVASGVIATDQERIEAIPERQLIPGREYRLQVEFRVQRHVPGTYSYTTMERYSFEAPLQYLEILPESENLEEVPTVISANQELLTWEATLNVGTSTHSIYEGMRVALYRQLYVPGSEGKVFLFRIGEGVVKYAFRTSAIIQVRYDEDKPRIGDKAFRISP